MAIVFERIIRRIKGFLFMYEFLYASRKMIGELISMPAVSMTNF